MQRAERSVGTEMRRRPRAMGEELVRGAVVYALVCEDEDDRVVGGLEMVRGRGGRT